LTVRPRPVPVASVAHLAVRVVNTQFAAIR
jgi:hypothetical protein